MVLSLIEDSDSLLLALHLYMQQCLSRERSCIVVLVTAARGGVFPNE